MKSFFLSPPRLLARFQSSDTFWKVQDNRYNLKLFWTLSATIMCVIETKIGAMLFGSLIEDGGNEPLGQCCE